MSLDDYRKKIDEIDRVLIEKLEERMKVAENIAEYKMKEGLPITDYQREKALLDKVMELSSPEFAMYNRMLFTGIMEASKDHQRRMGNCETKVACQGVYGAYSQEACEKMFKLPKKRNNDLMKIIVINGPNLNMLGIREPDIYGRESYDDLVSFISSEGRKRNVTVDVFQSNHEGEIVELIQRAYGHYDGIIINPAAYTHTSIAIADALKAVGIPTVEVHISDVSKREDYRQISFVREIAVASCQGEGFMAYAHAMDILLGI